MTSKPYKTTTDGPPMTPPTDQAPLMPLRTFFDVLAAPARRYAIYYLRAHGGATDLHELVVHTAAWKIGAPPDTIPPDEYEAAYIDFIQTHLPRLRDTGVIEYDLPNERVRFTAPAKDVFDAFALDDASLEKPEQPRKS